MGKKFKKVLFGAAALVAAYYGQGWLSRIFYAIGFNTLLSVAVDSIAGTGRGRQGPPPLNITVRGTVEYRRLIFGRVRAGGVLVFYGSTGTNNNFLWYVIAYAGHQSSAFADFWLDERFIPTANIPGGSGGVVSAAPWNSKLVIYKHLGGSTQTVDTELDAAFAQWTTNHKLQGITYAAVRLERDETVFPDGAPFSISTLLDGMLGYDARLDSTNGGSGSQRYADPSTWAFTRNPVAHARWYITGGSVHNDDSTCFKMYGLREPDSRIEESYAIASANICDETLSGPNAPPVGASTTRYTCDLEVNCGETRREILNAIIATLSGAITYAHGKWRIHAGAYDAPTHDLTSDDLFGDLEVQDTVGHDVRYNAVAPIFIDSRSQYIQVKGNYRTDSSYETQDGNQRFPKDLVLDGVTDFGQAQRLAEIELRRSRMMRSIRLNGALNLMRIAMHETLTLTHPRYEWVDRVFRAKGKGLKLEEEAGKVVIDAVREDSGVWEDILTADYASGTSNTDASFLDVPEPPSNLRTVGQANGILVIWDPSPTPGVLYEVDESTSVSMTSPTTFKTADSQRLFEKVATGTFYYRVRATRNGVNSVYNPVANGVASAATAVDAALRATASPGAVWKVVQTSSATTGSCVVTAAGGTSPYTYSWARVSGDSSIAITSSTSASTTFSRTGLVVNTDYSAIFRCTVTDNVSATTTVDVTVTISREPNH